MDECMNTDSSGFSIYDNMKQTQCIQPCGGLKVSRADGVELQAASAWRPLGSMAGQ